MLHNISLQSVLCLDIETVPQYPAFTHVPQEAQKLWLRKSEFLKPRDTDSDPALYDRAGIYAEFGKIVCISTGLLHKSSGRRTFQMQSFCGDDESMLLEDFANMLEEMDDETLLCAHNGKEFDFPYLCRRMLINGIKIPHLLQISGKKPWEVSHLDTMELWKFGDHKHYTPLQLLAYSFGIADPKNDIDGSMVGNVYWQGGELARIKDYCVKDVVTVIQILLRMKGEMILEESEITTAAS
jgi:DNA polymerase elongation subunit (family B)